MDPPTDLEDPYLRGSGNFGHSHTRSLEHMNSSDPKSNTDRSARSSCSLWWELAGVHSMVLCSASDSMVLRSASGSTSRVDDGSLNLPKAFLMPYCPGNTSWATYKCASSNAHP